MSIKTVRHPPDSPYLAPCDFWLFPKLRGCRYETIEEMKEAVIKVIDTLTQEDFHWAFQKLFGTVEQAHFSRTRSLRRGLEFHVCTINKVPIRKKSGNFFNAPRTLAIYPYMVNFCFNIISSDLLFIYYLLFITLLEKSPVSLDCRIHRLHICIGVRPHKKESLK